MDNHKAMTAKGCHANDPQCRHAPILAPAALSDVNYFFGREI
jgi:hypothetical protein